MQKNVKFCLEFCVIVNTKENSQRFQKVAMQSKAFAGGCIWKGIGHKTNYFCESYWISHGPVNLLPPDVVTGKLFMDMMKRIKMKNMCVQDTR